MSSMSEEVTQKYKIMLTEAGFKKLETFLKIAVTRAEEVFIEINPEEDTIKVNCIDPSHVSNVIGILSNNDQYDDFKIENLDSILQFNLKSSDLYKILTLNADSDITIMPNIDKKNNFDSLKFVISQGTVVTKEIFVPILEATNEDLYEGSKRLVTELLGSHNILVIRLELDFFIEILKESLVFNNERIRFNVKTKGTTINSLSVETFDTETDKTRRIKNNLFEGLHYARLKLTNTDQNENNFKVLVSFSDLNKLLVTSKIYKSINIILAEQSPLCLLYHEPDEQDLTNSVIALLAPIIKESEESTPS